MRAIKDRRDQASHEPGDLRGLGRDPILTDSAPYACLTVMTTSTIKGEEAFKDICSQFDLVQEVSTIEPKSVLHFSHRQRKDGQHKSQAVDLYGVALVLLNRDQGARCVLHEVKQLQRRLGNFNREVEAEYGPNHGTQLIQHTSPGHLTVATPVTIYLHEAGIGTLSGTATTTHSLNQMKDLLKGTRKAAKESKTVPLRKVG